MKLKFPFSTALLLAATLIGATHSAYAAQPQISDATLDRIVERLESSGKLDAAIERNVQRRMQQQQEAKQKQQEEQQAKQKELSKNVRKPDAANDHLQGKQNAEITLIEFSDYECPFCKRFHGTPESVLKRFDGKVNLAWRHFPLEFHNPAANMEAMASECVAQLKGNQAFWTYTDAVMQRTQSNGRGLPSTAAQQNGMQALLGELNVDKSAFEKCMADPQTQASIKADIEDGIKSGISGTPGLIIYNNKTGETDAIVGAVPANVIEEAVSKMLSNAK